MNSAKIRQNVFPVLAALIWGTAFVAQSVGAERIEPFTFNTIRSAIAAVFLFFLSLVFDRVKPERKEQKTNWKQLIIGGLSCGVALGIASFLQQSGIGDSGAGKAGFITALYVVLVPILGIFIKKKAPAQVWVSVLIAVCGLYLLCIKQGFKIETSDIYLIGCALLFAIQILCIDHFVGVVDGIKLSCAQFTVATIFSGFGMLIFEHPIAADIWACILPLLYVGIFSSGIAYTLQILAQKDANPTVVSLLLCLESVFATISGAIILLEKMSGREYLGCVLMFVAVVLSQIPFGTIKNKNNKRNEN